MRASFLTVVLCAHALLSSKAAAIEVNIKENKEIKDALAVSHDFKLYAAREKDGQSNYAVKIKDLTTGKEVKKLDWDKGWGSPYDAHFSPDDKQLSLISQPIGSTRTGKVFDIGSGELTFNVRLHAGLQFAVFSPDSKNLATAGGMGAAEPANTLWLWDIATNRRKGIFQCPTTPTSIAFSPNGKLIVSAHGQYSSNPPILTVCSVANGMQIGEFGRNEKEDVVAVAFSPNSKLVAAGTRDGVVKLFDVTKRKEIATFDDIQEEILSVAFHPKDNLLAANGNDKTIRFYDLGTNKLKSRVCPNFLAGLSDGGARGCPVLRPLVAAFQ